MQFRISIEELAAIREQVADRERIDALLEWAKQHGSRIDGVVDLIESAFEGVQLGAGIGLSEADGLDAYASEAELQEMRQRDERLDWRRIASSDLNRYPDSIPHFDRAGFLFHLPAFLIAALNDDYRFDFVPNLYLEGDFSDSWRAQLTLAQRQAVIATLRLIRYHPDYEGDAKQIDAVIARLETAA